MINVCATCLLLLLNGTMLESTDAWLTLSRYVSYPLPGVTPKNGVLVRIWPDGRMERASDPEHPGENFQRGRLSPDTIRKLTSQFDAAWRNDFRSHCFISADSTTQKLSLTIEGLYTFFECDAFDPPMVHLNATLWQLPISKASEAKH